MGNYLDIARGRAAPGILIFDKRINLVYANDQALAQLPGLKKKRIPAEVVALCEDVKRCVRRREAGGNCAVIGEAGGSAWGLRAFWIDKFSHIMVLVEKIVDRRLNDVDFDALRGRHDLSARETEVLRLVCQGLANKTIARKLFISEYTVKDHVKNIMTKMAIDSRSGIIARVLFPEQFDAASTPGGPGPKSSKG